MSCLNSPLPQLAPKQTVQDCTGGESMTTYVSLTDSGIEPSLPRQKAETSVTQPSGRQPVLVLERKLN